MRHQRCRLKLVTVCLQTKKYYEVNKDNVLPDLDKAMHGLGDKKLAKPAHGWPEGTKVSHVILHPLSGLYRVQAKKFHSLELILQNTKAEAVFEYMLQRNPEPTAVFVKGHAAQKAKGVPMVEPTAKPATKRDAPSLTQAKAKRRKEKTLASTDIAATQAAPVADDGSLKQPLKSAMKAPRQPKRFYRIPSVPGSCLVRVRETLSAAVKQCSGDTVLLRNEQADRLLMYQAIAAKLRCLQEERSCQNATTAEHQHQHADEE